VLYRGHMKHPQISRTTAVLCFREKKSKTIVD
jgi:hypothetical protein